MRKVLLRKKSDNSEFEIQMYKKMSYWVSYGLVTKESYNTVIKNIANGEAGVYRTNGPEGTIVELNLTSVPNGTTNDNITNLKTY